MRIDRGAHRGQHESQGDERQVARDELRSTRDPADACEGLRRHVADVIALDRDDTGVVPNALRQLTVPDVDRDHRICTALAEHLREPTRGGTHIKGEASGNLDRERIESRDELVCSAADVVIELGDLDHRRGLDLDRRLHDGATVDGHESVVDEARRVCA